jgi:hypothetical protein
MSIRQWYTQLARWDNSGSNKTPNFSGNATVSDGDATYYQAL